MHPIVNWLINNFIVLFFNIKLRTSFNDLKSQLLTGHCYNTVFWFQWNLIFEIFIFRKDMSLRYINIIITHKIIFMVFIL